MNPEDLRRLIMQGESERLELKASVPQPENIARILASFANGEGGLLVLGVREPAEIVGVDEERARTAVAAARRFLSGYIDVQLEVVALDGHSVPVITVPRAPGLVAASGGYYRRVGDRTRALTAEEIREHLSPNQKPDASITELASAVAQQTQTIDQLRADFAKANSTGRKLFIGGVGAGVGAVIKFVIEHWL